MVSLPTVFRLCERRSGEHSQSPLYRNARSRSICLLSSCISGHISRLLSRLALAERCGENSIGSILALLRAGWNGFTTHIGQWRGEMQRRNPLFGQSRVIWSGISFPPIEHLTLSRTRQIGRGNLDFRVKA